MARTACNVDGCNRLRMSAAGLCSMHYKRFKRHGTTEKLDLTDQWRAKISASLTGKKQSAETKSKRAASMTGKVFTAEHRQKIADGHRKGRKNTGFCLLPGCEKKEFAKGWCQRHYASNKKYGSPGHVDSKEHRAVFCASRTRDPRPWHLHEYNGIMFRSRWEVRFAKVLDALGKKWTYEPRRFLLGDCSYTPDFYLEEDDAFFEVKGWFDPKSKMKVGRFREMYPEHPLVLVNKQVLHQFERSAPMLN